VKAPKPHKEMVSGGVGFSLKSPSTLTFFGVNRTRAYQYAN